MASEIKPGDRVASGPWTVKRVDRYIEGCLAASIREDAWDQEIFVDGLMVADCMLWHPALPAVAALLASEPGLAAAVKASAQAAVAA